MNLKQAAALRELIKKYGPEVAKSHGNVKKLTDYDKDELLKSLILTDMDDQIVNAVSWANELWPSADDDVSEFLAASLVNFIRHSATLIASTDKPTQVKKFALAQLDKFLNEELPDESTKH